MSGSVELLKKRRQKDPDHYWVSMSQQVFAFGSNIESSSSLYTPARYFILIANRPEGGIWKLSEKNCAR